MYVTAVRPTPRKAMVPFHGILIAVAFMMMTVPASAGSAIDRSISLSSQQWRDVDQMTNTALFASLGINIVRGVHAIERAQAAFPDMLRALRDGDESLGLEPAPTPDVLARIARVESLWRRYDSVMQTIVHDLRWKPLVDEADIEALIDIHVLITDAVDDMTEAFRRSRQRLTTTRHTESVAI